MFKNSNSPRCEPATTISFSKQIMNIYICKQITFYSYFTLVMKGIARRAVLGKKMIIILVIITITVIVRNDQIITYIYIYMYIIDITVLLIKNISVLYQKL